MQLQTVRPNIVQAIRAYRVDDLMQAAGTAGQHFLYANLAQAQSKQDVLEQIATDFTFPVHFGKNLDALYDCMTDLVHKAGPQPGFVVVLEQLPDNPRRRGAAHHRRRHHAPDRHGSRQSRCRRQLSRGHTQSARGRAARDLCPGTPPVRAKRG